MNALIQAGKVQPIKGGRGGGKAGKGMQLGVGKRGSLIIPANVVQELEINSQDKFSVRKTKAGIALKKVWTDAVIVILRFKWQVNFRLPFGFFANQISTLNFPQNRIRKLRKEFSATCGIVFSGNYLHGPIDLITASWFQNKSSANIYSGWGFSQCSGNSRPSEERDSYAWKKFCPVDKPERTGRPSIFQSNTKFPMEDGSRRAGLPKTASLPTVMTSRRRPARVTRKEPYKMSST